MFWLILILTFLSLIAFFRVQRLDSLLSALARRVSEMELAIAELTGSPTAAATPRAAREEPAEAPPPPEAEAAAPVEPPALEAVAPEPLPEPAPEPLPSDPVEPPPGRPPRPPAEPGRSLEERFGARLPVWIGAISLILAGAFLVKISFERGWLGPTVRVALGVLFGALLLAAGEALRRASTRIASALSASGIAVLFVSFFAAVGLYHLIPDWTGFLLMALTTAVAVGLSLRQGPIVAALGLIGGFATPYLTGAERPSVGLLVLYLLLLQAGLLAVSRRRGWWPLAAAGFFGSLAWLGLLVLGPLAGGSPLLLGVLLLGSAALLAASALAPGLGPAAGWAARAGELTWLAGAGALAGFLMVGASFGLTTETLLQFALLVAGCLALARLDARFRALALIGAAAPAALLVSRGVGLTNETIGPYLLWALVFGLLLAAGGYLALFPLPQPSGFGWLSAGSAMVFTLLAYAGAESVGLAYPWGAICLVIAVAYVAGAVPLARRRTRDGEIEGAVAALAAAATGFASLAVPIELERHWLTVAWALEVAALVWLAGRLRIAILTRIATVLAGLVVVRLLLNPEIASYPIGTHPLLNWLTYGYGISALALGTAAFLAHRSSLARLSYGLQWAALALVAALGGLLVRQAFHPGDLAGESFSVYEFSAVGIVWLGLAAGLVRLGRRLEVGSFEQCAAALAALVVGFVIPAVTVIANPAWNPYPVGATPILNHLLWLYGLPAALLLWVARENPRLPSIAMRRPSQLGALLATFTLVTLEARQAFRGGRLDVGEATPGEQYAYSAAWIVFALVLLGIGIVGRGRWLRLTSLLIMLLAVGKVFLYDMGELGGFYRVFSFLALGSSLLLIAWLYQRFVFRE